MAKMGAKNSAKKANAKVLKIGILGSTGRMGQLLRQLVQDETAAGKPVELVYSASGPNDPCFGLIEKDRPDVLIDFSAPASTLAAAAVCGRLKIPMLVCTTGFTPAQSKKLEASLKSVPWALAPNTSVGVYSLCRALRAIAPQISTAHKVIIEETHHIHKKDAPSGTALLLGAALYNVNPNIDIEILSIRAGTEVGEHRVMVIWPAERLEFTHRAGDRSLFARGALSLASALKSKKSKGSSYSLDELF